MLFYFGKSNKIVGREFLWGCRARRARSKYSSRVLSDLHAAFECKFFRPESFLAPPWLQMFWSEPAERDFMVLLGHSDPRDRQMVCVKRAVDVCVCVCVWVWVCVCVCGEGGEEASCQQIPVHSLQLKGCMCSCESKCQKLIFFCTLYIPACTDDEKAVQSGWK